MINIVKNRDRQWECYLTYVKAIGSGKREYGFLL